MPPADQRHPIEPVEPEGVPLPARVMVVIASAGIAGLLFDAALYGLGVLSLLAGPVALVALDRHARAENRRPKPDDPVFAFLEARLTHHAARQNLPLARASDISAMAWRFGDHAVQAEPAQYTGGMLGAAEDDLLDDVPAVALLEVALDETCDFTVPLVRLHFDLDIPFDCQPKRAFGPTGTPTGDPSFDRTVAISGEPLAVLAWLDDRRRGLVQREVDRGRLVGRRLTVTLAMQVPRTREQILAIAVDIVERLTTPWTPAAPRIANAIDATGSPLHRRRCFEALAEHAPTDPITRQTAEALTAHRDETLATAARVFLARVDGRP